MQSEIFWLPRLMVTLSSEILGLVLERWALVGLKQAKTCVSNALCLDRTGLSGRDSRTLTARPATIHLSRFTILMNDLQIPNETRYLARNPVVA